MTTERYRIFLEVVVNPEDGPAMPRPYGEFDREEFCEWWLAAARESIQAGADRDGVQLDPTTETITTELIRTDAGQEIFPLRVSVAVATALGD